MCLANANQGIAIDNAAAITLDGDTVTNHGGIGVWIKHGDATDDHALFAREQLARRAVRLGLSRPVRPVSGSTVTGNGIDGQQFNGDGVELDGSGDTVQTSTITGNGDGIGFEHGIYVGQTAIRLHDHGKPDRPGTRGPTSRPPAAPD